MSIKIGVCGNTTVPVVLARGGWRSHVNTFKVSGFVKYLMTRCARALRAFMQVMKENQLLMCMA